MTTGSVIPTTEVLVAAGFGTRGVGRGSMMGGGVTPAVGFTGGVTTGVTLGVVRVTGAVTTAGFAGRAVGVGVGVRVGVVGLPVGDTTAAAGRVTGSVRVPILAGCSGTTGRNSCVVFTSSSWAGSAPVGKVGHAMLLSSVNPMGSAPSVDTPCPALSADGITRGTTEALVGTNATKAGPGLVGGVTTTEALAVAGCTVTTPGAPLLAATPWFPNSIVGASVTRVLPAGSDVIGPSRPATGCRAPSTAAVSEPLALIGCTGVVAAAETPAAAVVCALAGAISVTGGDQSLAGADE
jgi:hypothetical protein